jgi:hypothetical protein
VLIAACLTFSVEQEQRAALSNEKEKLLAKRREYQRNQRTRLKAGANASNLVDTSQLVINEKNIQGFF